MTTGLVFDIQKFSIHDGPGIRTTVFLKGCPLRCVWCHNPESQSSRPELSFLPEKCIGCGACLRVCPRGAHTLEDGRHVLRRDLCEVCGTCTRECFSGALELTGRTMTVDAVLAEVWKDRAFYAHSGGGMTLSGGEPLLQPDFSEALLAAAKAEGIHGCVETCGFANPDRIDRIAKRADLFLYDLKETDDARHRACTGAPLGPVLANLRRLYDLGAQIILRLPVVPTLNDRPEHFAAVARLTAEMPRLVGVEVMPYHRFGLGKRTRFGLPENGTQEIEPPDTSTVRRWLDALNGLGVRVLNPRG